MSEVTGERQTRGQRQTGGRDRGERTAPASTIDARLAAETELQVRKTMTVNPSEEQQHTYGSHDRRTRHEGQGKHTHRAIFEASGPEDRQRHTPARSKGLPNICGASLTESRPRRNLQPLPVAPSRAGLPEAPGRKFVSPQRTVTLQSGMANECEPRHKTWRFLWRLDPSRTGGGFGYA